ncbi:Nramp family divalent metal transporter [Jiulongibacter sediminis]|uniref:Iron transporter n=1 Tax=Jiulongibacter sediminis TaxID=1605367 RepID=A0A0P7C2X0_9BACT|nr:Nramp family divalent metal transporter [Jiulongibacter sediminis]KPM47595.1 iron transporter [Jiulongibacter sediminis]
MDPYRPSPESIKEPPLSLSDRLRHLGPSLILSAAIVGSGELIATTTLGAKAGFITFWLIIIGCMIKVMVQLAFGKHTLLTGETAMKAFNDLPGIRTKRANWAVWSMSLMMVLKLLQMGGIIGGVAIILNIALPFLPITIWAAFSALLVAFLVSQGYYRFIEKFSIFMIAFFTLFTFTTLFFLQFTPYALEWTEIKSGLTFQLPKASLAFAFGAFGITGVGGDEIIHYNYWCLEKGYAAYSGKPDQSAEWQRRVKGWLKVMNLDALIAMVIYTTVTAAFYLLGAAVLYKSGNIPEGYGMIDALSTIYTETLGPNARLFFLAGAFVVLFSTLFASLAAWTRQFADLFGQLGLVDFFNTSERIKVIKKLSWVLPLIWVSLFLFIEKPVFMVLLGGIVGSVILFLVVGAVLYFRYRRTSIEFKPTLAYDILLILSSISIIGIGIYGIVKLF